MRAGECWAIVGPNGAGKTTLLRTLAGLARARRRRDRLRRHAARGAGAARAGARRGLLPQDTVDFFPATVLETVLVGRHPHLARWQWETAADVARARAALAAVGLAGFERATSRTLSGGERRRVALAALLAQDPDLMLLDEPSSHLDLAHQIAVLDVLAGLARGRGKAIVMVLHDLHLALRYADHAIALGDGRRAPAPPGHSHRRRAVGALRPSARRGRQRDDVDAGARVRMLTYAGADRLGDTRCLPPIA